MKAVSNETKIVIDIGEQDSKAIFLNNQGNIIDFAMNDKCAAGTGRFLESMSRVLEIDIQTMGKMNKGAVKNIALISMCTVFAESEVVSIIANGVELCEIIASMNHSIALRTFGLIKRLVENHNKFSIAMSGGVAKNSGVVRALSQILNSNIIVPNNPDSIGALGAALIARKNSTT